MKKIFEKGIKSTLQVSFLQRCVTFDVVPKFLNFKVPAHLTAVSSGLRSCQLKALRRSLHQAKKENQKKLEDVQAAKLSMTDSERQILQPLLDQHVISTQKSVSQRHQKKLESLIRSQNKKENSQLESISDNFSETVINLSNVDLTNDERTALSLGFSMSWPKDKFDLTAAKAEAEAVFSKLKTLQAIPSDQEFAIVGKLRSAYKSYFSKNKKSVHKRIKPYLKALTQLAKNKNLYVAKFDKGNGVVIDSRENYNNKMANILEDTSKFKLYIPSSRSDKNPFILAEERFNRSLLRLRNAGDISDSVYQKIRSVGSQPARLYGLPKVHKNRVDPPYRPILSMINSYCSNLSRYLDDILKPFVPTRHTVKDSFDFADKIKSVTVPRDGLFVSFDVCSLFTNIPVESTINHICTLINDDELPFQKDILKTLLKLACSDVLFSFNNKLFVQHDGMSMGSILGPTMAAFALDMIEAKFQNYQGNHPLVYYRYVDDCLALFTSQKDAEDFLLFLNSHHPDLKFTIEYETDGSIAFLDTQIYHKADSVDVEWCLKKTNTGIYVPGCAYAPFKYKVAAMRSLFYRAKRISSPQFYERACDKIRHIFRANGFDDKTISKIEEQIDQKLKTDPSESNLKDNDTTQTVFWKLPYVQENEKVFNHKIRSLNKILPGAQIKPAFRTFKTSHIFKNKDPVAPCLTSKVVYDYQCDRCPGRYIGETRRHLDTRIREHLRGVPVPSEITMHPHPPKKENFRVVSKTSNVRLA
ncbi:MAG: reverse transcriptase domain-containing protein, partial [Pseudomonadota bacterium]